MKGMKGARTNRESGQAVVEYILLLAIVTSIFIVVSKGLTRAGLTKLLMKPLREDFSRAYQYGHPKALGFDDGGPKNHPRAEGENSFRLFINPHDDG